MVSPRIEVPRKRKASGGVSVVRNLERLISTSPALLVLFTYPAVAAKWEIVPSMTVEETYTDNVTLAPNEIKSQDWITSISPGLAVKATGARLKVDATYDPEFVYYARGKFTTPEGTSGENPDQVFHRGVAAASAELAKQLFFVDVGGNVNQYNVSLRAPLSASDTNVTGNRSTVWTYYASPYLRHDFGTEVQGEARYTYSSVNSDEQSTTSSSGLANSTANSVNLRLNSGPAYKALTWKVDYLGEKIEYGNTGRNTSSQVSSASATRLITPTFGLLARVGYDYYKTAEFAEPLKGNAWSAGFEWTPSPRTHLIATAGHRFYGDDYLLDFSHRTRLTTWNVNYSESVTTARSEFLVPATNSTSGFLDTLFSAQIPDPVARQRAVQDFIARTGLPPSLNDSVNFFSSQLFLVKRWQASAGILGIRNVIIAEVYKETRDTLNVNTILPDTGDFAASNSIEQTGVGLSWNSRLTAQNSWNMRVGFSRNQFPGTQQVDHYSYYGMGLTRQFEPRLSGSLSYRRQSNDSNQGASSFTENAVIASVRVRF